MSELRTDWKDDVFENFRKYLLTENSDGTVSLQDETVYTQEGDIFGAQALNEICAEINSNSSAASAAQTAADKAQSAADSAASAASTAQSAANAAQTTANNAYNGLTSGAVSKLGTATVGSGTRLFYLSSGTPTASTSNVGGSNQPVYMSNGSFVTCNTMLPLSGGTMTGQAIGYANTGYTTYQFRNIYLGTSLPSASTSQNGALAFIYA